MFIVAIRLHHQTTPVLIRHWQCNDVTENDVIGSWMNMHTLLASRPRQRVSTREVWTGLKHYRCAVKNIVFHDESLVVHTASQKVFCCLCLYWCSVSFLCNYTVLSSCLSFTCRSIFLLPSAFIATANTATSVVVKDSWMARGRGLTCKSVCMQTGLQLVLYLP